MLNLKGSKQTRSEASKNKVIITRASNKSINKSINQVNNQISFQILQKSHVILLKKNFRLKEKCYINKKNSFSCREKICTSSLLEN